MCIFTSSLAFTLLGIVTALFCVICSYVKWRQNYWKRKNFPYLEPTFPFGSMQNPFDRKGKAIGPFIEDMYNTVKNKGLKICGVYFMARPGLIVTDVDLVKRVLSKDFHYWMDRGVYHNEKTDPLSAHLFALEGNKWKNLRRKMTPTFTSGKMKAMFPILVECGKFLENGVKNAAQKGEPIDIKEVLGNFTTDVIGSCAFGLNCKSFDGNDSLFRLYGKKIFDRTFSGSIKRAFTNAFPTVSSLIGVSITETDVSEFFLKVVRDAISYRQKNNVNRQDFLQLMLEMQDLNDEYKGDGNTLTFNEIAAQCFVFFAAGFETSATTMTFTLFELARNPDIQEKAREEVNALWKKHDKLSYEVLADMVYLGQVIDESLRLYPPVPMVPRVCVEKYSLPEYDIEIEPGTRMLIPIIGIHHDPDNYKDPHKFDPERFSEANRSKVNQFAYLPFGEGPRICIGLRFGLMQAKAGLAILLKNFRITLNKKTKVPFKMARSSFVLSAEDGVWLDFEEIKN